MLDQWMTLNTPEIKKNTTVSTDPDKRSHILMNVDITFPNAPCYMIDMLMKTSINELNKDDLIKSLKWSHIDKKGVVYDTSEYKILPFPNVNTDEGDTGKLIKDFLEQGNSCNVEGQLDLRKVTGQLAFRLRGESKAWQSYNSQKEQTKLQMNHKINSITFGTTK
jgi:hypothetical protein